MIFETSFSCNRNETCWRLIVSYSIFVTSTNVFFSKTKSFVFAIIFNHFFFVCSKKNRNFIVDTCLQKISSWKKIIKLRLIENMRLKNFNLNEIDRLNVAEFAQKMLNIDNVIIIVIFNDDDKNWTLWRYDFLTNNSLTSLIKQIYSEFKNVFFKCWVFETTSYTRHCQHRCKTHQQRLRDWFIRLNSFQVQ